MYKLLTREESRNLDNQLITQFSIPSIILMENAAYNSALIINEYISNKSSKILILVGTGNNGGDGLAIARHLYNLGYKHIKSLIFGNIDKFTIDTKINYDILKNYNIELLNFNDKNQLDLKNFEYDILIEALIGTGGDEHLKQELSNFLTYFNNDSKFKIAIDIPAGLNANTGIAHQNTLNYHLTISMMSPKIGFYINDGLSKTGEIKISNLGISDEFIKSKNFILEKSDIMKIIPKRKKVSSKFDYGKILIIAGSEKFLGASALASNACIKSGAGLVYLYSVARHQSLLPEIIFIKSKNDNHLILDDYYYLQEFINKSTTIILGPGLGDNDDTIQLAKKVIYTNLDKKMVIDADALKAIDIQKKLSKNIILTPHFFEFLKLSKTELNELQKNYYNIIKEFALKLDCIILFKYFPSIITDGDITYFNIYGNPGMATAGSGDVLSGIIGFYLSIIEETLLAGAVSAFLHSTISDNYVKKYNQASLTASEMITHIKELDCLEK